MNFNIIRNCFQIYTKGNGNGKREWKEIKYNWGGGGQTHAIKSSLDSKSKPKNKNKSQSNPALILESAPEYNPNLNEKNLLIIIPTYNEKENIKNLIEAIFVLHENVNILIVDDNSPDKTYEIVQNLQSKFKNLHLIINENKGGLAKAYIAGFKFGMAQNFSYFLQMDADFSHNPKYIKDFLFQLKINDFVIGSRNIKGGGVIGWGVIRTIISKWGSVYARMILGVKIKDFTGGFNAMTLECLQKLQINQIISNGYCYQIEMKYRAFKAQCKIKEIPIIFEDRKYGKSKMNLKIVIEAFYKIFNIKKIVK